MTKGQAIRPSQFVYTFGVGSIVETPEGPGVVKAFSDWRTIFGERHPEMRLADFEITEPRLKTILEDDTDIRIFRLPTNDDFLNKSANMVIYKLKRFPLWALCTDHGYLYKMSGTNSSFCPDCGISKSNDQKRAIRFIQVCKDGHMSDIDWNFIVHDSSTNCTARYKWELGRGSSTQDVTLTCTEPGCNASVPLAKIYWTKLKCTGEYQESSKQSNCKEPAHAILRNAANVRIASNISLLTIPPFTDKLVSLLSPPGVQNVVLSHIATTPSWTRDTLIVALETIEKVNRSIGSARLNALKAANHSALEAAAKSFTNQCQKQSSSDPRVEEFKVLQDSIPDGRDDYFLKIQQNSSEIHPFGSALQIRVTPVDFLRVVTIQRGYRRFESWDQWESEIVPTFYQGRTSKWYSGLESFGEGIFIDMKNPKTLINSLNGPSASLWKNSSKVLANHQLNPVRIWWHSLSHRLITTLGIDSGYSSSAIRESLYFTPDSGGSGGVLLYATQKGGDGTLGGLVSLAYDYKNFDSIIKSTLAGIQTCTNDPLCSAVQYSRGKRNGSACYGCLLISETSCELMNQYLDRNIQRETI